MAGVAGHGNAHAAVVGVQDGEVETDVVAGKGRGTGLEFGHLGAAGNPDTKTARSKSLHVVLQ